MEFTGRLLVQLVVLICVVQLSLAQHWSYGWLPGGKRSVGELEATFRMMDAGDAAVVVPADVPIRQPIRLYEEESDALSAKRKRMLHKRRLLSQS
ncbi:gonadotropin-releasing hormone 3 [Chanos chanos]|uniref:Progonadoliberin n=1 Tax=Chanos chanos TaxID=29144 RepID=A0A6J2WCU0_CHACN|nr:progonadoliberin-3-like [Chanos chanos]